MLLTTRASTFNCLCQNMAVLEQNLPLIAVVIFALASIKLSVILISKIKKKWKLQKLTKGIENGGLDEPHFLFGNLRQVSRYNAGEVGIRFCLCSLWVCCGYRWRGVSSYYDTCSFNVVYHLYASWISWQFTSKNIRNL